MDTPANSAPNGEPGDKHNLGITVELPEKRGRGRPPGSGKKTQPESANGAKAAKTDESFDPVLFGDLLVGMAEIGDDVFVAVILSKGRAKLNDEHFEKFRLEMQRVRMGEKDKTMLHKAAVALAKKYTFLGKWGPELALFIFAIQYGTRMTNALRLVNNLPDQVKKVEPATAAQ